VTASGPTPEPPPPRAPTTARRILRWLEHVLAGAGLFFILYHAGFEIIVMTSDSMSPTLQGTSYEHGDRILVEKITGRFRSPKRWEIYYFYNDDGIAVAKRVVGLPGEKISIRTNVVYINGAALERPAALRSTKYYAYGKLDHDREVDCGTGYFVLGDASVDSWDSRFTGPVAGERFRGRVWCILSPGTRTGFVR